ncbi:hypothetical protein BDW02DRAFT_511246 [Decorospora gaudefroyi]|uniref:DUF7143 domain-containing protein n=1 Tax=Decorospora gaudefroyi TaxID=184978 RepID=A0A6A5JWE6_9PLEO|nr:hypothetical protein BDW02DRAFT_511246 [Decorospora gaudefroyi]
MYSHAITTLALLSGLACALPTTGVKPRQADACFIIGDAELPEIVVDTVIAVQDAITCSPDVTTLSNVPDVTSGSITFSDFDFSKSGQSPLEFALQMFTTAEPLASNDLQLFQDGLNVYLATEAGIRSVGGELSIKVPKFFLEMQISRIQTAQGNPPTEAGLQVDHLRDKVTSNGAGEDQALLDQVIALATQLQ